LQGLRQQQIYVMMQVGRFRLSLSDRLFQPFYNTPGRLEMLLQIGCVRIERLMELACASIIIAVLLIGVE
jgi:hypothetical protein